MSIDHFFQHEVARLAPYLHRGYPVKFITENPGRQLTGSFRPVFKSTREWYGKYYAGTD